MMISLANSRYADALTFLDDDVMSETCFQHDGEDTSELLSVICDGDPRSNRGFDFDAYRTGGVA